MRICKIRGQDFLIVNASDEMLSFVQEVVGESSASPATKAMVLFRAFGVSAPPLWKPPSEITELPDGRVKSTADFMYALDFDEFNVEFYCQFLLASLDHKIERLREFSDNPEIAARLTKLSTTQSRMEEILDDPNLRIKLLTGDVEAFEEMANQLQGINLDVNIASDDPNDPKSLSYTPKTSARKKKPSTKKPASNSQATVNVDDNTKRVQELEAELERLKSSSGK